MASKTITVSTLNPTAPIISLYAGDSLTTSQTNTLLLEANLDEVSRDVQSVPRLFSQGSFVISSRIDSRDITLTSNIVNVSNKVLSLRAQLDALPYNQKIKVVYNDDGYITEFSDCRFTSWNFRKVGSKNEYEVILSLRSFDGK